MRAIIRMDSPEFFGIEYETPWLTRVHVKKVQNEWLVWVPPRYPQDFDAPAPTTLAEWQSILDHAHINDPYGDSYYDTFEEAIEFAMRCAEEEEQRIYHMEACS